MSEYFPHTTAQRTEVDSNESWMNDEADLFGEYDTTQYDFAAQAARHNTDYQGLVAGFEDLSDGSLASLDDTE